MSPGGTEKNEGLMFMGAHVLSNTMSQAMSIGTITASFCYNNMNNHNSNTQKRQQTQQKNTTTEKPHQQKHNKSTKKLTNKQQQQHNKCDKMTQDELLLQQRTANTLRDSRAHLQRQLHNKEADLNRWWLRWLTSVLWLVKASVVVV